MLINNAGALIKRTPVADYTDDFVDAVLELNVKQVVRFMREAAVQMRKQGGGGSIINVSSIAARHGGGPGSVIYAAAKGFVATATRGWAKELVRDRIRVNAVSPGVIMTPFHERYSTAEQLAAMQATIPMDRLGTARRMRRRLPLSRLRADERLRHRPDHRGQWRAVHAVSPTSPSGRGGSQNP